MIKHDCMFQIKMEYFQGKVIGVSFFLVSLETNGNKRKEGIGITLPKKKELKTLFCSVYNFASNGYLSF